MSFGAWLNMAFIRKGVSKHVTTNESTEKDLPTEGVIVFQAVVTVLRVGGGAF